MKNKQTITKQLGISQSTIAELLMISRVQYALYETGKRDLPVASKLLLAKILSFNEEEIINKEKEIMQHHQIKKTQAVFEQEYTIYKHKQIVVDKKLKKMEEKYQSALSALRLVSFLESKTSLFHSNSQQLLESIRMKALQEIDKNGIHEQVKLQLKRESLYLYKKQLEEKLQNFFKNET